MINKDSIVWYVLTGLVCVVAWFLKFIHTDLTSSIKEQQERQNKLESEVKLLEAKSNEMERMLEVHISNLKETMQNKLDLISTQISNLGEKIK